MPLSKSNLLELVKSETQNDIDRSDYRTLRTFLLNRKPLSNVIISIMALLDVQYLEESQSFEAQLTQEVCEAQELEDHAESENDEDWEDVDTQLAIQYQGEIISLNNDLSDLEQLKLKKEAFYHRVHNIYTSLEILCTKKKNDDLSVQSELSTLEQRLERAGQDAAAANTEVENIISKIEEQKFLILLVQARKSRAERAEARLLEDEDLMQLSAENYKKLNDKLKQRFSELKEKERLLRNQALSCSYAVFLEQLETAPLTQLSGNEKRALRSICKLMKSYEQLTSEENALHRSLLEIKLKLTRLQSVVAQNPELAAKNSQLIMDNTAAENHRRTALNFAIFGIGAGFLNVGVGYAYSLSPAYFFFPAALGVLSFVALVAAIAYHVSHLEAERQIMDNDRTILQSNAVDLIEPNNEFSLDAQIQNATQEIIDLEHSLTNLQARKEELLDKAKEVVEQPMFTQQMMFAPARRVQSSTPSHHDTASQSDPDTDSGYNGVTL
jgi:hypothetical protein